MPWYDALTGAAFRQWCLTVAGTDRVKQGQRLDPFQTSMRTFAAASDWLSAIQNHDPLEPRGGGGSQQVTDLQGAQLVARANDVVSLTSLGEAVLAHWRELGVADTSDSNELPRCLVVVKAASQMRVPEYTAMLDFWKEIRQVFQPTSAIGSPEALYLLSYLNREVDGYNPWMVIKSAKLPVPAGSADWDAILRYLPGNDDTGIRAAIERLKRRLVDFSTRAAGRQTFCKAMELYCA